MAYLPEEKEEERLGGAQADREWLVEYVVELPDDNPIRMITIIRGAEMSDIILPSAAYTEQDGYFTNLEGRMQKAYNASYPPGEAKEDWQIINELAASIKRKNLYTNKEELINVMKNYLKLNKDKIFEVPNYEFINEKIYIDDLDYYHSNSIARASKTMSDCKDISLNLKKTGTDG